MQDPGASSVDPATNSRVPRGATTLRQVARRLDAQWAGLEAGPEISADLIGDPSYEPFLRGKRWVSLFGPEMNLVRATVAKLDSTPSAVSAEEVASALETARELERIVLSAQVQSFQGMWVAVKNNRVVASSNDREDLFGQVQSLRFPVDMVYRVSNADFDAWTAQ